MRVLDTTDVEGQCLRYFAGVRLVFHTHFIEGLSIIVNSGTRCATFYLQGLCSQGTV
jgi:hypothetical protein